MGGRLFEGLTDAVMHCATTNGIGSRIFFLAAKYVGGSGQQPIVRRSGFCIDFGPASRGGIPTFRRLEDLFGRWARKAEF